MYKLRHLRHKISNLPLQRATSLTAIILETCCRTYFKSITAPFVRNQMTEDGQQETKKWRRLHFPANSSYSIENAFAGCSADDAAIQMIRTKRCDLVIYTRRIAWTNGNFARVQLPSHLLFLFSFLISNLTLPPLASGAAEYRFQDRRPRVEIYPWRHCCLCRSFSVTICISWMYPPANSSDVNRTVKFRTDPLCRTVYHLLCATMISHWTRSSSDQRLLYPTNTTRCRCGVSANMVLFTSN